MKTVSVLVVIVNYRTAELTVEAIASLEGEVLARGDAHVVVVDNGSDDGSAALIARGIEQRGFGGWCTLKAVDRNGGFAAGNNAALDCYRETMGQELPEFVWLLNPDTLAHAGAIGALVDFLRAHPRVGIAGGRCLWEDGRVRYSAFRFISPVTELIAAVNFGPFTRLLGGRNVGVEPTDQPARVDWVSGSSLMMRRTVIDTIGPMDEAYFLYFEETDFCAKASDAGFEIWTVPASVITHIGGQATGASGEQRRLKRRPRYWFESRARFLVRRYGVAGAHLANFSWLAAYPLGRLIGSLRGHRGHESPRIWRDFAAANYGRGGLMYRASDLSA